MTAGNLLRPTRPLIEVYESQTFQTSTVSRGSQQHCIVIRHPNLGRQSCPAHSCNDRDMKNESLIFHESLPLCDYVALQQLAS